MRNRKLWALALVGGLALLFVIGAHGAGLAGRYKGRSLAPDRTARRLNTTRF